MPFKRIALIACLTASSAVAQTAERISATALAQDPARYLNRQIRVDGFACWSDAAAYRCASGKGLDLIPAAIAPAAVKRAIDEGCGGLDGIERTPGCLFDLVFTPTGLARGEGDIVRNGRATTGQIWILRAGAVSATRGR